VDSRTNPVVMVAYTCQLERCGKVFERPWRAGRKPHFCSKSCKEHDYRDRCAGDLKAWCEERSTREQKPWAAERWPGGYLRWWRVTWQQRWVREVQRRGPRKGFISYLPLIVRREQ